jgi:predicted DNA-binding transcriptional regulator AlpA
MRIRKYQTLPGSQRLRPEHWLVQDGRKPTDEDGDTMRLYDWIMSQYGLNNQQLCGMLGVPPDRPSKWRSWLMGTLSRQKRPIPEDMQERLLALKEKLMKDNAPRYLKRPEVATMLRASPMSIGRWSQAGIFPKPIKLGKHYLYDRQEVEDFLANQKREQNDAK